MAEHHHCINVVFMCFMAYHIIRISTVCATECSEWQYERSMIPIFLTNGQKCHEHVGIMIIPLQRASDGEFWSFSLLSSWISRRFETPRRSCNATAMDRVALKFFAIWQWNTQCIPRVTFRVWLCFCLVIHWLYAYYSGLPPWHWMGRCQAQCLIGSTRNDPVITRKESTTVYLHTKGVLLYGNKWGHWHSHRLTYSVHHSWCRVSMSFQIHLLTRVGT